MNNSKIKINLDSLKNRREWKRHKVKDGSNIFRILPPFGENSNGYPYRKWQIIWGLLDPETGRARPFASSMTTEKKCPVTEFVGILKKKAETLKSKLQSAGEPEEVIKDKLSSLYRLISDLSPKTVYVYNAVDKSGEVGLLELKTTAHKKMKAEMSQYIQDYNQDPTSLNSSDDDSGVWFNITRQGVGRDTEYDVKKCQVKTKNAQGKISFEDDRSPLPDSVVSNYENLAYDLSSVYQIKTYNELKQILESNIPHILQNYPGLDLTEELALFTSSEKLKVSPNMSEKRTQSIKLDDEDDVGGHEEDHFDDDEDDDASISVGRPMSSLNDKSTHKMKTKIESDDDFLAYADELLKS